MGFEIGTDLWRAPGFPNLPESAQLLYIYLITGPEAALSVPGLVLCGPQSLAEARRCSVEHIQGLLAELSAGGWIEIDGDARLIGVPRGPIMVPPGNTNVVKGWWRRWRDLPDSPVKVHHLEPLREVICVVRRWTAVWATTFGTVHVPPSSKPFPTGNGDDGEEAGNGESLSKDFGKGSTTPSSSVDGLKPSESLSKGSRSEILDPRSEILDPSPRSQIQPVLPLGAPEGGGQVVPLAVGTSPGTEVSRIQLARRLWALQEELIAELPYEVLPREATDADVRLVALALESYKVEDLEYVQRVFAARAATDERQAVWFNRRSNWHPDQIERALRSVIASPTKGRVRAGGKKRYGGSAFDTP